ncbi:zinc ABC transporter substrate-binding protein [Sagittula stellata]|uniref:High-affinity zinc uptake system protein ZnuA n=1 Tax=Sagittula stellata (strain ATCC 700073 / DSM 11524 / E-37) TaxID=388399 RepID=A3K090_SAGS3|nr:zinc ABC transporter substrate-binding protein [Sagittula stellata]EBA09205.1 ABC zinc transporter, periplasmic binding protein ZnuA [Sagittula stellata E-37]
MRLPLFPACNAAALSLALIAGPAIAEVPRVITDIPPVASLAAMVLGDLGAPEVLVAPGTSAHGASLKPSQARALETADVVVWIGPALTPGIARQIEALAGDAQRLTLSELPETHVLPFRDGGLAPHDHGAEAQAHYDHAHADDDHGDDMAHEDHAEDMHGADTHLDPHLWLDPENATAWLSAIATALSAQDPENAQTYAANARAGAARISDAAKTASVALGPVRDRPLAVTHDALQYYEAAFDLQVIGALTDGDDTAPGAQRLDALRALYTDTAPVCALTDPGTSPRLMHAVGLDTIPQAEIDPLGSALPQGAPLYPALVEDIAKRIAACAGR